jgi:hypothetical protein
MGLKDLVRTLLDKPIESEVKRQSRILSYTTEGKDSSGRKYVVTARGRTIYMDTPEYQDYLQTDGKYE